MRLYGPLLTALLLVGVWVSLFILVHLSEASFVILVITTPVILALLFNLDRLSKVVAETKWGKLLFETEAARQEIFATASAVRKMAREFGEFSARMLAVVGSFNTTSDSMILEVRDRLSTMLAEVGFGDCEIEETFRPLNDSYTGRLAVRFARTTAYELRDRNGGKPHPEGETYLRKYRSLAMSDSPACAQVVRDELKRDQLDTPKILQHLADLEEFRRTKALRPDMIDRMNAQD